MAFRLFCFTDSEKMHIIKGTRHSCAVTKPEIFSGKNTLCDTFLPTPFVFCGDKTGTYQPISERKLPSHG